MNLTEALNALEQAKKENVELMLQLEELTHKHARLIVSHSDMCKRYGDLIIDNYSAIIKRITNAKTETSDDVIGLLENWRREAEKQKKQVMISVYDYEVKK